MARAAKQSPQRRPPRPTVQKKKAAAPSPPKAAPAPLNEQQRRIESRFHAIFGNQFSGHHQYIQKKLLRLKNQLQLQDSKRPVRSLLEDFHEVDAYRCITNLRVCDAIRRGLFQRVETLDQLPNLVENEENELFGLKGVEITCGVKVTQNSAKLAKWRALGPYRSLKDGEKSRSVKILEPVEVETAERLKQFENEQLKEIRRQNRERR